MSHPEGAPYDPESAVPKEMESAHDSNNQSKTQPAKDPNLIDWDGPDDRENPRNWPNMLRNLHIVLISVFTLYV